jgi:hypothetical protein
MMERRVDTEGTDKDASSCIGRQAKKKYKPLVTDAWAIVLLPNVSKVEPTSFCS